MSRRLLVIGIGAGAPGHLTLQAIAAINRAEAFFVFDKGEASAELVVAREAILATHRRAPWRLIRVKSPKRHAAPRVHLPEVDAAAPAAVAAYRTGVADWDRARAVRLAALIESELPAQGVGAMLVWGDPALYDSTLRVLREVQAVLPLAIEVVPGLSAVQALTSAHGLVLNEVGEKISFTTGRRVLKDYPGAGESLVVLLDDGSGLESLIAHEAQQVAPLTIWWGAYLGLHDQMLAQGRLAEVGLEILARRSEARARRGWIMDVWLVRS